MFGEKESNEVMKIDFSYTFIVKVILFVVGFAFLFLVRDIIGMILVSILLTAVITPFVDLLHKKKKAPRWVGIAIIYVGIIGIATLIIALLVPAISNEFKALIDKTPYLYQNISSWFSNIQSEALQSTLRDNVLNVVKGLFSKLQNGSGGLIQSFSGVVSGLSFFVITLVMTFYMAMEEDGSIRLVKALIPKKWHHFALNLLNKIQNVIVGWMKGQLSLSLIIGVLCYIALIIMGVNYSLLLALVAAVTELIPYIGPVLGAIPAVFIAFTQSPVKGIAIVIIYVIIQQLENNLIVPRVMKKSVGLNPLVVIIVILIGVKIAGIFGSLLAVPVTAIIQIIANEVFHLDQEGIFKEKEEKTDDIKIIE